jgi:hypothetical protein
MQIVLAICEQMIYSSKDCIKDYERRACEDEQNASYKRHY